MIDQSKLLAWLRERFVGSEVGQAIYLGLAARIERGEFDEERGENQA